ncbi:MAG: acyl-CoA dehydrogenase family protein [Polyangiales bacterium]
MDVQAIAQRVKTVVTSAVDPHAARNDKEARFPAEGVKALGEAGLLGLLLPTTVGGLGGGPRAFTEVVAALAESDPSLAMVYVMHVSGTACIAGAPKTELTTKALVDIAAGKHLTTLAFSEKGSRSHFWAPVSQATKDGTGVKLTAQKSWVTSAGHADSYVISTKSTAAKGPTDTTLYLVAKDAPGFKVSAPWDGLGLRGNASAPMTLEGTKVGDDARLTDEGAGFKAKLEVVLPLFNIGQAAMSLGICRAVTAATVTHLKTAQFEHLGASLGEALPTLRAKLADLQVATDRLAAFLSDVVSHLETPGPLTVLRVLESKLAAGDAAIAVTSGAMAMCGGAAFSRHTAIERFFRDAHASAVMVPTSDVLREFIGKALLGLPLF